MIVSSFDLDAVDAVRALAPELATGWLTHGQDVAAAAARSRAEHGHAVAAPRPSTRRSTPAATAIARAHDARRARRRVDRRRSRRRSRALAAAGVDAIITNVPDVALAALGVTRQGNDERRARRARSRCRARSTSPRSSPSTWYGNGSSAVDA